MQSRGHSPHSVVSHNSSQAEGRDHLSERCVWGDDTQSQTGGQAYRETEPSSFVVMFVCLDSSFQIAIVGKMCSFSFSPY